MSWIKSAVTKQERKNKSLPNKPAPTDIHEDRNTTPSLLSTAQFEHSLNSTIK